MCEETNVGSHLVHCSTKVGQGEDDIVVDLARVCLRADWVSVWEAEKLSDACVQCFHFAVIAIEQGEEGRLCACRSLDTSEAEVVASAGEVTEVPEEFLWSALSLLVEYSTQNTPGSIESHACRPS